MSRSLLAYCSTLFKRGTQNTAQTREKHLMHNKHMQFQRLLTLLSHTKIQISLYININLVQNLSRWASWTSDEVQNITKFFEQDPPKSAQAYLLRSDPLLQSLFLPKLPDRNHQSSTKTKFIKTICIWNQFNNMQRQDS